jgi:hypothetical protein
MELKQRYKNINDTLNYLRLQVEESKPFARSYVPKFNDPVQFFLWLKPQLKYRNDPKDTELLQSFGTLMINNFYGTPGMGDCDCFTIAALSGCYVQKWNNKKLYITLAGRNKFTPVHIWSGVILDGQNYPLDFTNAIPGKVRSYPFTQTLYLKDINK